VKKKSFIGFVPYSHRKIKKLGEIPLDKLTVIDETSRPKGTINDLEADDHVLIYPSSRIWLLNTSKLTCKVSLIIAEPKVIHGHYFKLLWLFREKFFRIFVRYQELSDKYDNVESLPLGDTWVDKSIEFNTNGKDLLASIIASDKNRYAGHKLRHNAIKHLNTIEHIDLRVLGRGYTSFDNKEDGLLPFMFSIIIENVQEKYYFTEKLIDCLLCGTVPIYWGAPNISDYFDTRGFITFNNENDLVTIMKNLTKKDYSNRAEFIKSNYETARRLCDCTAGITSVLAQTT